MSSPLEFARQFEKLKSQVERQPAADIRLLMLVDFWPVLKPHKADSAYDSYLQEYHGLGLDAIKESDLPDLTLEELEILLTCLQDMGLDASAKIVAKQKARSCLYVHDTKGVLDALGFIVGQDATTLGDENPEIYSDSQAMLSLMDDRFPEMMQLFKSITAELEAERTQVHSDQVHCLFVEDDPRTGTPRGRMARLRGEVTKLSGGSTHEVSFENQVKSPDDPFVGAMYDALGATRTLFMKDAGYRAGKYPYMKSRFAIDSYSHTFTGDSIGMAAALLAFAQVAKIDVQRLERFIGSDVAVTGGIQEGGLTQPVNKGTLDAKIRRAFFSHVKYLLLGEESLSEARRLLEPLEKKHYGRRLLLIGHRSLADAVADHNVMRSEKLCIGEFVAKRAYKYSRATRIQIPLLVLILYALVCIPIPKARFWFDWNPAHVVLEGSTIYVLNADSVGLWDVSFACDSLLPSSNRVVEDITGDGMNELLFLPHAVSLCPSSESFYVYDYDGTLRFTRSTRLDGFDLWSEDVGNWHDGSGLYVARAGEEKCLISYENLSNPARCQIKLWSARGDSLGWYVNRGFAGFRMAVDVNDDGIEDLLFSGTNNRLGCAVVFALHVDSSRGVSPVSFDSDVNWEGPSPGNQLRYVALIPTDVCSGVFGRKNDVVSAVLEPAALANTIRIDTQEGPTQRLGIRYYFTEDLRLKAAIPVDAFKEDVSLMRVAANQPELDWTKYSENLLNSVQLLDGERWVPARVP